MSVQIIKKVRNTCIRERKKIILVIASNRRLTINDIYEDLELNRKEYHVKLVVAEDLNYSPQKRINRIIRENDIQKENGDIVIFWEEDLLRNFTKEGDNIKSIRTNEYEKRS